MQKPENKYIFIFTKSMLQNSELVNKRTLVYIEIVDSWKEQDAFLFCGSLVMRFEDDLVSKEIIILVSSWYGMIVLFTSNFTVYNFILMGHSSTCVAKNTFAKFTSYIMVAPFLSLYLRILPHFCGS